MMGPDSIVVIHYVTMDPLFGLLFAQIAIRRGPLCFQAAEEALHRCIIPAVTTSTDALLHPEAPDNLLIFHTCILASLITMEHDVYPTIAYVQKQMLISDAMLSVSVIQFKLQVGRELNGPESVKLAAVLDYIDEVEKVSTVAVVRLVDWPSLPE